MRSLGKYVKESVQRPFSSRFYTSDVGDLRLRNVTFWCDEDDTTYNIRTCSPTMQRFYDTGIILNSQRTCCVAMKHVDNFNICIVGCTLYMVIAGQRCKFHLCDFTYTFDIDRWQSDFINRCYTLGAWQKLYLHKKEIAASMAATAKSCFTVAYLQGRRRPVIAIESGRHMTAALIDALTPENFEY